MESHARWGLTALAVFMLALTSHAAEEKGTLEAQVPSAITGSLLVQSAATVNAADPRSTSGLYMITGGYTTSLGRGKLAATASIGYQNQYSYQGGATQTSIPDIMPEGKSGDWIDPRFSVTHKIADVGPLDSITYGAKATLAGLSYASERKTQSFAIGPHFGLTEGLGSVWKQLRKFTFSQSVDYRYVHHHYRTQNNGRINSPHVVILSSVLDYTLGSRSGIALSAGYSYAVSYQNVGRALLGGGLEFYYSLTDKLSLALGLSNGTTGQTADGQSFELDILKPESATGYFNIDIKI